VAALVVRARDGDIDAYGRLVRIFQHQAVSVAFRLLGNREDADDVGQDAFVRAFRGLSQLEDPARFAPWLMRVVTNTALNFRRGRKLRMAASLGDGETLVDSPAATVAGRRSADCWRDGSGALPEEVYAAVTRAIGSLPEKQRLALVLFSIEGMPQKDVAEVLDCSIELVKWNVFQARKKLKELLSDYLE
jgi:RNA polymerase sigma-70 factor (ECF subfamily)